MQRRIGKPDTRATHLRTAIACVLLALAQLMLAPPALALERVELYRVEIEHVPGTPRAEIERRAMEQVLVRVTGRTDAPFAPELAPLLQRAGDYVTATANVAANRMSFVFNSSRVDDELIRAGQPVWGADRPLTLAWIAIENDRGERALVGVDTQAGISDDMARLIDDVRAELRRVAADRGVPFEVPLLDVEDLAAVAITDVIGEFDDVVVAASRRYGADAVLLGRIQTGGFGGVRLLLVRNGERESIPPAYTVREGLDAVATRFAADLAAVGAATPVRLTVLDVANGGDWGRVRSYLDGLSDVRSFDVLSMVNGALALRVATRGGAQQLERVLSSGGVLADAGQSNPTLPRGGGGGATGDELVFRLRR